MASFRYQYAFRKPLSRGWNLAVDRRSGPVAGKLRQRGQASGSVCAFDLPPSPHKKLFGQIMVRHICATGLWSKPSPSPGWLNSAAMMSSNSSIFGLVSGSKA